MMRHRQHPRRRTAAVTAVVAALVVAGCGSGTSGGGPAQAPTGEPRAGGSLTLIMPSEQANLDPASFNNTYAAGSAVGNALYGQLVTNDPVTGELVLDMAAGLGTADTVTWTLQLKPGITFSDGTPLDAAAVKYNWDRMKDPKTAAPVNVAAAAPIASTAVVDPLTLSFTLSRPSAHFGQDILNSALTYIASPTALQMGPEAFTAAPVGAGPFVLESWIRQDRMVLEKNPGYYDAPRPYLDELIIRTDTDTPRRLQALQAGDADIVMATAAEQIAQAEQMGLVVTRDPLNGTNMVMFNTAAAPFDDVRARRAVQAAVDVDAVNAAVYGGFATVPRTLMAEGTPFYDPELTFPAPDRDRAQQLFDELAAEGKPVEFTLLSAQSADSSRIVQSFQAQLQSFRNVTVEVETMDMPAWFTRLASGNFGASVFGVLMVDPEPTLGRLLSSTSPGNFMKFTDPQTDAAIGAARASTDLAARTEAYRIVQRRVIDLVPFIGYARPPVALVSQPDVGGMVFYGGGSPRVDTLWLDRTRK